jgi:glycosyltransferase involved in cell wall biosynthesis
MKNRMNVADEHPPGRAACGIVSDCAGRAPAPSRACVKIALIGLGRYSGASPIPLHLAVSLSHAHELRAFIGREALNLSQWSRSGVPFEAHAVYGSAPSAALQTLWPARLLRIARSIRRFAPDVLLVPFNHPWVLPLQLLVQRPLVLAVHDPEPHPGWFGRMAQAVERATVRRASHIVIHSAVFRRLLVHRYGVADDRVTVIPIGPLTDYLRQSTTAPSGGEAPTILCFGRMETYKGLEVLLEAAPLIRQHIPSVRIVLAGRFTDAGLRARALDTAGVVVCDGWVEERDVTGFFSRADVVVLPYTSATQSGVVPIAAAFSLPVVVTRTGGLPEQVRDGTCGVVVRPGDAGELAGALVNLLRDRDRSRALGKALHEEYLGTRSWAALGLQWTRALEATVAAARSGRRGEGVKSDA